MVLSLSLLHSGLSRALYLRSLDADPALKGGHAAQEDCSQADRPARTAESESRSLILPSPAALQGCLSRTTASAVGTEQKLRGFHYPSAALPPACCRSAEPLDRLLLHRPQPLAQRLRQPGFKQPQGGTAARKQKAPKRLGAGPDRGAAVAAVRRKHRRRPGVVALREVRCCPARRAPELAA